MYSTVADIVSLRVEVAMGVPRPSVMISHTRGLTTAAPVERVLPPRGRNIADRPAIGWPGKTVDQYRRYLDDQAAETRAGFVSLFGGSFAGYLTVRWNSDYAPFCAAGIPEIKDLNVLPQFRRRRIASTLMDAAEALIAARAGTAGIGVGLYADYRAAHLMYLRSGYLPDGHGVAYRGTTVAAGSSVRVDDDLALMMTRRLR